MKSYASLRGRASRTCVPRQSLGTRANTLSTLSTIQMDPTENLNDPAERRKAVRLSVRPDLQVFEQKYEGKTFHVVKDPVCLLYYRFNRQEYFVFQLFAGEHTLEQVRDRFEDEYKPHRLEYQDLE